MLWPNFSSHHYITVNTFLLLEDLWKICWAHWSIDKNTTNKKNTTRLILRNENRFKSKIFSSKNTIEINKERADPWPLRPSEKSQALPCHKHSGKSEGSLVEFMCRREKLDCAACKKVVHWTKMLEGWSSLRQTVRTPSSACCCKIQLMSKTAGQSESDNRDRSAGQLTQSKNPTKKKKYPSVLNYMRCTRTTNNEVRLVFKCVC